MIYTLNRLKLIVVGLMLVAFTLTATSCGAARKPVAKKHSGCNCGF